MSKLCAARKCVLGGTGVGGIGGKALVRDQSGVIAHAAAAVVPVLVRAPVPRDLRVDPGEGKSKEMSLGAWNKAVLVVGAGVVSMIVPPSTPGTRRRSSQKYAVSGRGRSLIFSSEFP